MIITDVNLLLYATLPHFPEHRVARVWLEEALQEPGKLGLCSVSVFGFVRLATNRRVFTQPRRIADAISDVRGWLDAGASWLTPGPLHLELAFGILEQLGTAGNLTTDAQLAALAIEHRAQLHSADADFGRIRGLRWVNPVAAG